jgi:hypothetical protein
MECSPLCLCAPASSPHCALASPRLCVKHFQINTIAFRRVSVLPHGRDLQRREPNISR